MNAIKAFPGLRTRPWLVFKKALLIFLPLMLISAVVLDQLWRVERDIELRASRGMELLAANIGQKQIDSILAPVAEDLDFLAMLTESDLGPVRGDDAAGLTRLREQFALFSKSHEIYDQLRFLDRNGQEQVRVDNKDGQVVVVGGDQLQNKRDRYYFADSIKLERDDVYISPLDLNIEHGQLELPHKPMIRLAKPVFAADGRKLGVVIINYKAAHLLTHLRQTKRPGPSELMLLNRDGYWFMSPNPDEEWGFMLPGRAGLTMAKLHPELWRSISQRDSGQLRTDAGLFSFVTARPIAEIKASGGGRVLGSRGAYFWKVVSLLPAQALLARAEAWRELALTIGAALALVWGLLAWGLAWAWTLRQASAQALRQTNEELEQRVAARTAELSATTQSLKKEIVERIEVQKALRDSEEKYRAMMQSMEDAVYICSGDYDIEYMNPAMIAKIGRDATSEKCHAALYDREDVCPWCVMDLVEQGRHVDYELDDEHNQANYHVSNGPLTHQDGSVSKLTVFRDITRLKDQERALEESSALYRNLFQSMLPGVIYRDADGRIVSANPAAEKILGIQIDPDGAAPQGSLAFEALREDGTPQPPDEHPFEVALRTGKEIHGVVVGLRHPQTKSLRWISVDAVPLFKPGQDKPHQVFTTFEDITQRVIAQRIREARLRLLELSASCDSATLLQKTIDIAEELTEASIGFYHFMDDDQKALHLQVWSSNTLATMCAAKVEKTHYPVDSAGVWVDCVRQRRPVIHNDYQALPDKRGLPEGHAKLVNELVAPVFRRDKIVAILGVGNKPADFDQENVNVVSQLADLAWDIVERMKAEENRAMLETQLRHAQKMEAIGTLAGGIAHDFNNILSAIIGYSELAKMELPPDSHVQDYLDSMLRAGGRAAELIKQILSFSRQSKQENQPISVTPIVKEVVKLINASTFSAIEVRQSYTSDIDMVLADPTNLHQVVMNLCTNARQAMQDSGGVLTIDVDNVSVSPQDAARYEIQEGEFLRLSVSDTGVGMDQKTMSRIFEPFFTTKELGKGTGLGLSVLHGIVKDLGGSIRVYSEPGKGSTFQVYLPLLASETEQKAAVDQKTPLGGSERILFVDDEAALVDIGQQILAPLGYEVLGFTSSLEALAAFRQEPDDFDLVFTDQNMPGLTGLEMAAEMMRLRPKLPVILCSGFSEQISAEKALEAGFKGFLYKPILTSKMVTAIREALDGAGGQKNLAALWSRGMGVDQRLKAH